MTTWKIGDLIDGLEVQDFSGDPATPVCDISNHSKEVKPGDLFVCVTGYRDDGHRYALEAVDRGAVGLVVERAVTGIPPVAVVRVSSSRRAMALISSRLFGDPSSRLKLVGITGTNGKTTVSYMLDSIFRKAGYRTGLIGTISYCFLDQRFPACRTTPESRQLQGLLRKMADAGVEYVSMEVSSHALELERVTGCRFRVAALTNVSRDHLEFHGDISKYLRAKARLFEGLEGDARAVVNGDDPSAGFMVQRTRAGVIRYGLGPGHDIGADRLEPCAGGTRCNISYPGGSLELHVPFPGKINVYNALAAFAVGWAEGLDPEVVAAAIGETGPIPGRYQLIHEGQEFSVMVDFAHNPDALGKILETVRGICSGEIILVFGCEGEKDPGKRPIMGEIAARGADIVIVTSDNVYGEDPLNIARDIEKGLISGGAKRYQIEIDRGEAIKKALELASPGSAVVVAGKGHEEHIVYNCRKVLFNDEFVIRKLLRRGLKPPTA